MEAGAAVAVWLLAAGESGLLVGRRQHDLFARVGAGGKYLGLVGRGGVEQSAGACWCRDKRRRKTRMMNVRTRRRRWRKRDSTP